MAATAEDRALASAILSGDSAACEVFDAKYRPRIEWIARCYGVRPEDCPDIAQESLAAALSQIQRGMFRGESRLGTWLEAIVRGKIVDYRRSPGKRPIPVAGDGSGRGEGLTPASHLLVCTPNPELVMATRELIRKLPPRHRVVLVLNKVGGFTTHEIGRRLRWPNGTVGRVLSEAQQMFRQIYAEAEEFGRVRRQSIGEGDE